MSVVASRLGLPPSRRAALLGAPLDELTFAECLAAVEQAVAGTSAPATHASINAAKLVRIQEDADLCAALWDSDLVTADGQPVVWVARLFGRRLRERVAGIDLMEALLAHGDARGWSVFLLGARPDVVTEVAATLSARHPGLEIVGARDGYFGADEEDEIVAEIAAAAPDLLFVALDTPRKELFLARHRAALRARFAMGVGGAFDVLSGRRRRAPVWAQRVGLEWLFRLLQEPRRLLRRYAVGNAQFVALVVRELAGRRHA